MGTKVQCESCETFFEAHLIKVTPSGNFFCWRSEGEGGTSTCIPNGDIFKRPMATIRFTWLNLHFLSEYIKGSRELETLEAIDELESRIDRALLLHYKTVMEKGIESGQIQKSDSESLGSGNEEHGSIPRDGESRSTD